MYGKSQFGARGLYPLISKNGILDGVKTRLNTIFYFDSNQSLLDIAEWCQVGLEELIFEVELFMQGGKVKLYILDAM